ncbi:MAG: hypothetical protein K6B65_00585 [Bacilli bacterium]|nr:hypothetical protein [Bacilli bacterium]
MIQFIITHLANKAQSKRKQNKESFLRRHQDEVAEAYAINYIGNINNDFMN